jgi:hypothetical protein
MAEKAPGIIWLPHANTATGKKAIDETFFQSESHIHLLGERFITRVSVTE